MANQSTHFLDITPEFMRYETARYAILPVPYEGTVCYKTGTAAGPLAILDASRLVELFDEELQTESHFAGIHTLAAVPPAPGPEEQMRRVYEAARPVVGDGKFLLALGGEHSISSALVRAVVEQYGELTVLQIDAHADLRDTYTGTALSHGSVMRRILEITGSICQVGIRSYSKEEFTQCPEQVRNFVTPAVIATDSRWQDRVLKQLRPKVYITIDVDGLDPAYAPGTGTPEPGGLDWQQLTGLLRRVCCEREVVGADIVEVRPLGENHITEFMAARLAYKLIAYTQQGQRP